MKTIEVTNDMYESLMSISKELNTQSHRCTRMPYMIQVSKKKEVSAYEGQGEEFWFGDEGRKLESQSDIDEAVKEYLHDKYAEEDDDRFDELDEHDKEQILEDLDYRKHNVTEVDELSEFFFTDKGLRSQYGDDVNTFLTGSDSPELKTIMTFLCEMSNGKLHR